MRITSPALPQSSTPEGIKRYSWPCERHLTPTHCGYCGVRLLRGQIPTADDSLVDVTCLLCSRVACELAADGMRRPPTPDQFAAMPQRKRGPKPPDGTTLERVIKLLRLGGSMHPEYLIERLSVSVDALRNAVSLARQCGYEIATTKQGYRLEREP